MGLSAFFPVAYADDVCLEKSLVVNGFSSHFKEKTKYARTHGYNEQNYGLGYKCRVSDFGSFEQAIEVGFLRNSYRATSLYASYELMKKLNDNFSVGLRASVNGGYQVLKYSYDGYVAGISPTVKFRFNDRFSTNLSVTNNYVFVNFEAKL